MTQGRLKPDDSLDPGFRDPLAAQSLLLEVVDNFAVYPDGLIILWTISEERPEPYELVRWWSDGTYDASFHPSESVVKACAPARLLPLSDGKLLCLFGGDPWPTLAEARTVDGLPRHGLVRLNADGGVDPGLQDPFGPKPDGGRFSTLKAATALADGRLCVAWEGIHRLLPDGKLDPTFRVPPPDYVLDLVPQNNDRLLVLTAWWSPGSLTDDRPRYHSLSRRNPDGSLDSTFNARALERSTSFEHVLLTPIIFSLGITTKSKPQPICSIGISCLRSEKMPI